MEKNLTIKIEKEVKLYCQQWRPKMNREKLAEQLHIWYLEAIKKISPESYNPNAIKEYSELAEDQKEIDKYMAGRLISRLNAVKLKIDEGKLLYLLNERNSLGIRLNEQGAEAIAYAIAQKAEEWIR